MYPSYFVASPRDSQAVAANGGNIVFEWKAVTGRTAHKVMAIDGSYDSKPAAAKLLTIEITDQKGNYQVVRRYWITEGGPFPLYAGVQTPQGAGLRIILQADTTAAATLNILGYENVGRGDS